MPDPIALPTFTTEVLPDWIDYNGHMRDSYYGQVFSTAVDQFMDELGISAPYRSETGCTLYVAETHQHFIQEVKLGAILVVNTRVVNCRPRTVHVFMMMTVGRDTVATYECVLVHVNQRQQNRAVPFPDRVLRRCDALVVAGGRSFNPGKPSRKIELHPSSQIGS